MCHRTYAGHVRLSYLLNYKIFSSSEQGDHKAPHQNTITNILVQFFSFMVVQPWYLDNFETFYVVSPCSLLFFAKKITCFAKGAILFAAAELKSFFRVPDRLTTLWGIFHFGRVDKIPLIYAKTFRCLLPQKTNRTNNPLIFMLYFKNFFSMTLQV